MGSSSFVDGSSSSASHDQTRDPISLSSARARDPVLIEAVESSVEKLIRNWNRRKRWLVMLGVRSTRGEESQQQAAALNLDARWRTSLAQFLDSNPIHIATILLLVADVILTILEISSSIVVDCTGKRPGVEDYWYHWVGISILCVLLVKSLCLVLAYGVSFFNRPGYVVDLSVLIGAMFMETLLEGRGGGLLVVVSLWRVLRLVESAFQLSDDAIEKQINEIMLQLESLRTDIRLTIS